jgi:hypothetical protein
VIDSYLEAEFSILQCISPGYTKFIHLFLVSSLIQIPTNFELLRAIASQEAATVLTFQTQAFILSLSRYFHAFPSPVQNTDYGTSISTQELVNKAKSFFASPQTFSLPMTITSLVPTVEQQLTMPEIVAEEAIFIRNTTGGATITTFNLRIKGHADDVARH